jgi:hypothetical protein
MYTVVVTFNDTETFTYGSDIDGLFNLILALNKSDFVRNIKVFLGNCLYTSNDFNWIDLDKWTTE